MGRAHHDGQELEHLPERRLGEERGPEGQELLLNYGEAYWEHDHPLDGDTYDDPRLFFS